jgi:hypothetical protein
LIAGTDDVQDNYRRCRRQSGIWHRDAAAGDESRTLSGWQILSNTLIML